MKVSISTGKAWGVPHARLRKLEERQRSGKLYGRFRVWYVAQSDGARAEHRGFWK